MKYSTISNENNLLSKIQSPETKIQKSNYIKKKPFWMVKNTVSKLLIYILSHREISNILIY